MTGKPKRGRPPSLPLPEGAPTSETNEEIGSNPIVPSPFEDLVNGGSSEDEATSETIDTTGANANSNNFTITEPPRRTLSLRPRKAGTKPVTKTPSQPSSKQTNDADTANLKHLQDASLNIPLIEVCPTAVKRKPLTDGEIRQIVERIRKIYDIPLPYALIAIYLLILKGAANTGTPTTFEIEISDPDGRRFPISKNDLLVQYKSVTKNSFLRRLAESLAEDICRFAEKRNLSGDLANKINTKLIAKNEAPLTTKERAWCSSFCQNIVNFGSFSSDRLPILLAEDYLATKEKNKKKTLANPPKKPTTPKNAPKAEGEQPKDAKKTK